MKAHKLDRKINLLTSTSTTNDVGESVQTWATSMSVWAQVKYRSGSEDFTDNIEVKSQGVSFIIRYQSAINTKYRVSFNGDTYEIDAISEPKRKELQELQCRLTEA